jgi:hypothetical protein
VVTVGVVTFLVVVTGVVVGVVVAVTVLTTATVVGVDVFLLTVTVEGTTVG